MGGFLAFLLTFFRHETLSNIRQSIKDEELCFIGVSMMAGILIYLESFLEQTLAINIIQAAFGAILFLTIIEEYIKHLIVRFVDDKKLKDIDDAITLSITVGLAFAFLETLFYAFSTQDLHLMFYRSFLSIPIHLVASGIFGYFYGLAHFSQPIAGRKKPLHLHIFHRIMTLKKETVYREEKMVEGLTLAVLFHAACNILFEVDLAFLVVPIIVAGLFMISFLYQRSHFLYHFFVEKKKCLNYD